MNKLKELNYKFGKEYDKLLHKSKDLRDRPSLRVLAKDYADEVFKAALSGDSTNYPIDLSNPESRFPVFGCLPAAGKSTGLTKLIIPALSEILYAEEIMPIFIIVIPAYEAVFLQMKNDLEYAGDHNPIKTLTLGSKPDITAYKKGGLTFKTIAGNKVKGIVFLTKHSMINGGTVELSAKPYIKQLFAMFYKQLKKDTGYDIMTCAFFDEVSVSSQINSEVLKYKAKISIEQKVSYMPSLEDFLNDSILPLSDRFVSIGMDGTPTRDITGVAPQKPGGKLWGSAQDADYSVTVDYGGGKSIWYYKKPSEEVWKGANGLDVAYYSGITSRPLNRWEELVTIANDRVTKINKYNVKAAKELDSQLKKYGVKILDKQRLLLVVCGSDVESWQNHKYVKGTELSEFLLNEKIPHITYTDDTENNFLWYFDGTTQHQCPDDVLWKDYQSIIYDMIDNGESQMLVLKRKLLRGWDNNLVLEVVGLSEYTDMYPQHPTMKPFSGPGQGATRAARACSGILDQDGELVDFYNLAEVVRKIQDDGNHKLAEKVLDVAILNNQFRTSQLDGESQIGGEDGQLTRWLENTYPDKKEFIEAIKQEIETVIPKQENETLIPESKHCPTCGCPNFGHNCKQSEIDLSDDKLKVEEVQILDNILDINKDKNDKINPSLLN